MFFNNLNAGPTQPPPYQQPSTSNPAPNAAIGVALPPPPVTVASTTPYQQPNAGNPAVNPAVTVSPVVNGNPLDVTGPQKPYIQEGQFPHYGGNMPQGIVAPVLHAPFSNIPG